MTRDDKEIVSALQRAVIDKVGRDLYHIWFDDAVEWQLREMRLTLDVENLFSLERLQRQFRHPINESICELRGTYPELVEGVIIRLTQAPAARKPVTAGDERTQTGSSSPHCGTPLTWIRSRSSIGMPARR